MAVLASEPAAGAPPLDFPRLIRHARQFLSAVFGSALLTAARCLLHARILGPALNGLWGSLSFYASFAHHLHLGAQEAMTRQLPRYRSQHVPDLAARSAQRTLTVFALLLAPATLAFWAVAALLPPATPALHRWAWIAAGLVTPLEVLYSFEQAVVRAEERFAFLSRALLWGAAAGLVLSLGLVLPWGFAGFLVVAVAPPAAGLWLLRRKAAYRWALAWDWAEIRAMIRLGWPVLLMGIVFDMLLWVDQVLVLRFVGLVGFGYYSLGLVLMRACFLLPQALSLVVEPRLHFDHEQAGDARTGEEHTWFLLDHLRWVMPLALLTLDLGLPPVFRRILPAYVEGLPVIRVLVWSSYLMGIAYATKSFLVAHHRQVAAIPVYLAATATTAAAGLLLLHWGWGLLGVALAATTGYAVCATGLLWLMFAHLRWRGWAALRHLARLYWPAAVAAATAAAPSLGGTPGVRTGALQLGALLASAVIVAWRLRGTLRLALPVRIANEGAPAG